MGKVNCVNILIVEKEGFEDIYTNRNTLRYDVPLRTLLLFTPRTKKTPVDDNIMTMSKKELSSLLPSATSNRGNKTDDQGTNNLAVDDWTRFGKQQIL